MPKRLSPREAQPTPLPSWTIYKLAAKHQWLGHVEAAHADAAIQAEQGNSIRMCGG